MYRYTLIHIYNVLLSIYIKIDSSETEDSPHFGEEKKVVGFEKNKERRRKIPEKTRDDVKHTRFLNVFDV